MSSAEIEAEIKKVLHISESHVLPNPVLNMNHTGTGSAQQNSIPDENKPTTSREPLTQPSSVQAKSSASSKISNTHNSNQMSEPRNGRNILQSPVVVTTAESIGSMSPRKRNRKKKKTEKAVPVMSDSLHGSPLESKLNISESKIQHSVMGSRGASVIGKSQQTVNVVTESRNTVSNVQDDNSHSVSSQKIEKVPNLIGKGSIHQSSKMTSVSLPASASGSASEAVTDPAASLGTVASSSTEHSCSIVLDSESAEKIAGKTPEPQSSAAKTADEKIKPSVPKAETKQPAPKNTILESSARQSAENTAVSNADENVNKELESNYIFPLKKKSSVSKFPLAKYFCRLCEYHCDNVGHCQRHIRDARHERLLKVVVEENILKNMPAPSKQHIEAVAQAIDILVAKVAMNESERKDRLTAFNKIKKIVSKISKDAVASVYGSTVSGFALKDSGLNIDLCNACPAKLLKDFYTTLQDDKSGYFKDVKNDFQSKCPSVYATIPSVNVRIQAAVNNNSCVQTSNLLSIYCQLDPRVKPLAIAFRHWAKVCKIDRQAEGMLPAYVFGLMTVYFLQQCQPPVLPVLHELLTSEEQSAGDGLEYLADVEKVHQRWQSKNTCDVGTLWIEMLRFFCLELDMNDAVICIRERKVIRRSEKKWTSKKLAVEDPFSCKRNVARSLSHGQMYEYIDEQLRCAYKYFGLASDDELNFSFDDAALIPKKGPAIICSICQRQGHFKANCPEETLPPLPRLPPLNRQYINVLNKVLHQVLEDFIPREREIRQRLALVGELQTIVRTTYPGAKLCLFGSSCNGFGFQYSDLDISLTFTDHETAENLNCVEIIETLAKKLKKHHAFYNVFAITTAKVPIIKFKHGRSQLEGDISLYNTLAQHNTRMLQMYSDIDPRIKILGYTLKVLAKSCEICDASRGSLSSYAYTLMVIYFLQQRNPPVVPVLQELYRNTKPETIIDGWNAWFYEDLKNLPRVWSGYGKNQESVAELWLGLLNFYTEHFNFKEYVISIRQKEPLTKFEKLWNGNGVAIEDPFNLDHNLGSALSRKMNLYIIKVLRNARKLHGTPIYDLPFRYTTMADYLFDQYQLTDSAPPNDRGCRRCGKIGHFINECPLMKKGKSQAPADHEDDDDNEDCLEKDTIRDIPVLVNQKVSSDPVKISSLAANPPSGNRSPERSSSQSSAGSDNSNQVVNDRSSTIGASSKPTTEPLVPVLNGPLVFHNSKISSPEVLQLTQQVINSQAMPSTECSPQIAAVGTSAPVAPNLTTPGISVPSLMSLNLPNWPLISNTASPGFQLMAQGNFGQTTNPSPGLFPFYANLGDKGQPILSGHQGQGHKQQSGQVNQPSLLMASQPQGQAIPMQKQAQGHIQGQVQNFSKGQESNQGQIQGQMQGESHLGMVNQPDSLANPNGRKEAVAGQMSTSNFPPFGTINHPSVVPMSPFTMFMAHQFNLNQQQQQQQQCQPQQQQQFQHQQLLQQQYQQMIQASLLQAIGHMPTGIHGSPLSRSPETGPEGNLGIKALAKIHPNTKPIQTVSQPYAQSVQPIAEAGGKGGVAAGFLSGAPLQQAMGHESGNSQMPMTSRDLKQQQATMTWPFGLSTTENSQKANPDIK